MRPTLFRPRVLAGLTIGLAAAVAITWWCWPRISPEQQYQRGLNAIASSDWPAVLRSAEALKGRQEFVSHAHLLRGVYYLKTNQPQAATQEFRLLNPVGDVREPALLYAGESLYRLQDLAAARQMFATLAAEQPGHVDAHRWLAAIAYDLGDFNRAMDELAIVIRQAPADYRPHLLIGQMQFDLEQYRAAIDSYSHAIAHDPPGKVLEEIRSFLAQAQMQNRDYSAALTTLAYADPSASNLALQAECQLSLGDEAAARGLITQAEEFDPEQPDLLRIRGRMELDAGHPDLAVAAFRAVLEHDPQDHQSRYQLSQALRLSGDLSAAEAESRRAAQMIELKAQLAKLTQEAISQPGDAGLRDRMADLCTQLGKTELAASWRKAAAACRQLQPPVVPETAPLKQ